jgi:hypothetical protein
MKKAIITLVAVTAALIAARRINRQPPLEPTVPYYNYN